MADVFISYHEKSAGELAAQIARTLEVGGISCWYAKRDIPTGADFARAIPPQIDACKVFLLILNENAQTSKHIESELGLAFSRSNRREDITIFPVEIGDFEWESWIKYYLIHTQILKAPVFDAERLQELVWRVAQLLNHEPFLWRQSPPPLKVEPMPTPIQPRIITSPVLPPNKYGKCGDSVNYAITENGTLIIYGNGSIQNFDWDESAGIYNTPWRNETITSVMIQNGVTKIGTGSFADCVDLQHVHIPSNVAYIEDWAFSDCKGLTTIIIPDSVATIERGTFCGCTALANVNIPNRVIKIEKYAFADCAGLTSVTIPDSVTSIGSEAFANCKKLKSVSVPAKAKIGWEAFPDSVTVTHRT